MMMVLSKGLAILFICHSIQRQLQNTMLLKLTLVQSSRAPVDGTDAKEGEEVEEGIHK